jgi:hypothetical protein
MTARTTSVDMSLEESEKRKSGIQKKNGRKAVCQNPLQCNLLLAGVHNLDDLFDN